MEPGSNLLRLDSAAVHTQIESLLGQLGRIAFQHAWLVLISVFSVVALGASQIPNIEIRTSTDEFLQHDDQTRVDYGAFLELFGRDDMMLIAIEPPMVFDLTFLEKLRDLHDRLEDEVPHVREVQSLINARETRGEEDQLIVSELFDEWPENQAELEVLRDRALANPLYTDLILSHDADLTVVTIELEAFTDSFESTDAFEGFDSESDDAEVSADVLRMTGDQEAETVSAVKGIVAEFDGPDFKIYVGGAPVLNTALMESLLSDIILFTALSTGLIGAFLTVVFRRMLGVVIPLTIALLSLFATLGAMGTFGIPAMPISEIVPSFLLSMGVGASVHLITIFLQRINAGATREEAIIGSLSHSGLPIIMTSLTTAGGIASFATADLVPIAIFGIVAPLGILLTLVITLLLAPAMLAVMPLSLSAIAEDAAPPKEPASIRILAKFGAFSTKNAGVVLTACAALTVIAIFGMLRLEVTFDSLEWFPDDMPAKVAAYKLDSDFGGSMSLELLVETSKVNGLHDPAVLQAMDRARHTVDKLQVGLIVAGKSVSLVDIVKEIHQALNEGRADARVIPNERNLISQELILFENSGSEDLEDMVDTQFRTGRFTIRTPMVDGSHYPPFGAEVARIFDAELPKGVTTKLTGLMMVMGRSFTASIDTMFRSYAIALLVITPLMMLLLGSVRLGLIAMIPNLFPIVLTLGLMGWTGQPLEMFSLLIGSVALGLAVDDTIHFMHGFRQRYAESGSVEIAVEKTVRTTGQALLFTSIVLTVGFLIYVLSDLSNLQRFGALTAFSIVIAFLADVLLAPALMKVMTRFSSLKKDAPTPH